MEHKCVISFVNYTKIICEMPAFAAPTDQAYSGGRGLKRQFWNNTALAFNFLEGKVKPTTTENWFDAEGPKDLRNEYYTLAGVLKYKSFAYRDVWKGLFKAPLTGKYKFLISGDDNTYFNIDTTTPFVKTKAVYDAKLLTSFSGWTGFRDFTKYTAQVSAEQSLVKD